MLQALGYNTELGNILVAVISTRLALGGGVTYSRVPGCSPLGRVHLGHGPIYSRCWLAVGACRAAQTRDELLPRSNADPLCPVVAFRRPKNGLKWSSPVKWLIYPLVYFTASLAVGSRTGRYLYPFGDVDAHGLSAVLRNGA